MARLYPQELSYKFGSVLRRGLKGKTVALTLVPELVDGLMDEVPTEAYEARCPADAGHLLFQGDVTEKSIADLQDELLSAHLSLKRGVPIELTLASCGGDVFACFSIVSTMQRIQRGVSGRPSREINVHVAGYALSAGSCILQAGTRRTIDPQGWLLIHEIADDLGYQKTHAHRDAVELQERMESTVIALYTARTSRDEAYYRKRWDRRDWYLTAAEALTERLVDEVLPAPNYRRRRST